MKILKKTVALVLAYMFAIALLPLNSLNQVVKASENDVPKYLKYEGIYYYATQQYKDKVLAGKNYNIFYLNGDKKSQMGNIYDTRHSISRKEVVIGGKIILNLEDGSTRSFTESDYYLNLKKGIDRFYNSANWKEIGFYPIESNGDIKWSKFYGVMEGRQCQGLVNSKGIVYETYDITTIKAVVYENDLYTQSFYGEFMKIGVDGTIAKDRPEGVSDPCDIYVNKDGIYLLNDLEGLRDLTKFKLENGKLIKLKETKVEEAARFAIDINNQIWKVSNGFVYKMENDQMVKKYQVDDKMKYIKVYDDNNLFVCGFESFSAINGAKGGRYTFINNTSNPTNIDKWIQVGNKWTYEKSGKRVTDWNKIDNKWYYFNSDGIMQTGWIKLSGIWYYLNASGDMATGWIKSDNKWYYLDNSGAMKTGEVKIDGKTYSFDKNGVWCK